MHICLVCRTKRRVYKSKWGSSNYNYPCVREGCYGTTTECTRNCYTLASVFYSTGFNIEKCEAVAVELDTAEPFAAVFLTVSLKGYYPEVMWEDLPNEFRVCYSEATGVSEQTTIIYNDNHDTNLFMAAKKGVAAEKRRVILKLKRYLLAKQANHDFDIYSLAGYLR